MSEGLYQRLREALDQFGAGFNATESGVEIDILKKIFTEEEARIYIHCTPRLEPISAIAQRVGRTPGQILPVLQRMAAHGLLFSSPPREKAETPTHFAAAPWIGGIVELQSSLPNRMDRGLAELCVKYFTGGFKFKGPFLRSIPSSKTIPVGRAIEDTRQIATYDDVKEIIKSKDRILIVPCACCDLAEHLGKEIDQPREVCFYFGAYADFFLSQGLGRWINHDEALQILDQCEEAGLVHQATNTRTTEVICNCGKFCGELMTIKRLPHPAQFSGSNYYSLVDPSLCTGCETCLPLCLMEAIAMEADSIAHIDLNRCIGCGVCVSNCPTDALSLQLKPEAERQAPPETNPTWKTSREYAEDIADTAKNARFKIAELGQGMIHIAPQFGDDWDED